MSPQYRQVLLARADTRHVAWIPAYLAQESQLVEIKQRTQNQAGWHLWAVLEVYGPTLAYEYLKEYGDDWRRQRACSDA